MVLFTQFLFVPLEVMFTKSLFLPLQGDAHTISVDYNMENASENSDWKFVSRCKVVFSQFKTLNFIWNNSYRVSNSCFLTV